MLSGTNKLLSWGPGPVPPAVVMAARGLARANSGIYEDSDDVN